jgi:hypothetical protein
MPVVLAGHAHGREAAVQKKSAVRLEIRTTRTGLRNIDFIVRVRPRNSANQICCPW